MSLINDALKRANQTPPGRPTAPARPSEPAFQPASESPTGKSPLLFFAAGAGVVVLLGLGGWLVWTGAFGKPENTPAIHASAALEDPHSTTTTAAESENSPTPKMPSAGGRLPAAPQKSLASAALAKATARAEAEAMKKKNINTTEVKLPTPAPLAPVQQPAPAPAAVTQPVAPEIPPTPPPPAASTVALAPAPVSPPPARIETIAPVPPPVVTSSPAPVVATVPPPPAPPPFPALKLRGIFYRRTNPTALINGETLAEGETVDDVKVVKIDRESVTVEWRGQSRALRLP